MIRYLFAILLCASALLLAACGEPPPDTSAPLPPNATLYERGQNQNVDLFLASFDGSVRELLKQQGFAVETQQSYSTAQSVGQVANFYATELAGRGWEEVPSGAPVSPNETLLTFQKSNVLFVVAAIDATKYRGEGVVIYTLKATK